MPSPIAHSLAGLSIAWLATPAGDSTQPARVRWMWAGACVFAGNAPDFDFFVGLVSGSVNAFHGGPTHSLVGALVFTLLVAAIARGRALPVLRTAGVLGFAYLAHITLDMMCGFPGQPNDLPLLWPLSATEYTAPWHPFPGILHGPQGGSLGQFLSEFLSVHNLRAFGVEALLGAPFLFAVCWGRRQHASRPSSARS